ncbi:MAG: hypothetical protein APR63_10900 [Desulfuromonas sp. SDB]|nr:MAG: hypothetical protein APR63_10900 [Desulfuromonas sp. SDB]
MKMNLTPNMEDYLECILQLKLSKKIVRVRDISKCLSVNMSSVTSALENLVKKELVFHERYGYVDLTKQGEQYARKILQRHEVLTKFFNEVLQVPLDIAENDACHIEHLISSVSFSRLFKLVSYLTENKHEQKLFRIDDIASILNKKD